MSKQIQHYVSQMLLKRFVDNTSKFYVYRKQARKLVYTTSGNIFCENHIYSITDECGNRDTSLEQKYSAIETIASAVLDGLILAARRDKDIILTKDDRLRIDEFILSQLIRVPDVHNNIPSMTDFHLNFSDSLKRFEKESRPLSNDERASFGRPDQEERIKRNILNMALKEGHPENIKDLISSIGLHICLIGAPNTSFIIGSNPITTSRHDGRGLFADPDDQLWFPVASDVAIVLTGTVTSKHNLVLRDKKYIRLINEAVFEQSSIVAAGLKDLICSLSARHRKQDKKT